MGRKRVQMSRDHLERQSRCQPLAALEELLWNGLDAGGPGVEVRFDLQELRAVRKIEVRDFGNGIHPSQLERTFGTVGNSIKLSQKANPEGRLLHGKEGRGRFKALSLGPKATWETTYRDDGHLWSYKITVQREDMEFFDATEPVPAKNKRTGTVVTIEDVDQGQLLLVDDRAREVLAEKFALYLRTYPNTFIEYQGRKIDVQQMIDHSADYDLDVAALGRKPATLSVIEWRFKVDSKKLFLCDRQGFAWHEVKAGVQGRGLEFSAYLSSDDIKAWQQSGHLGEAELLPEISDLVDVAKDRLRQHIRERLAAEAGEVVAQWKKDEIYPYSDAEAQNPLKKTEQEVFNIVATRVNEHHRPLREGDLEGKRLTLVLIKQALEGNPSSLTTILRDVVKLPPQEQDELASLLKRTPLTALIKAGKIVVERLDTVQAFEHIIFSSDWKEKLLERTQLHRLLVHQLWILGEEYTLDNDDESLRQVLKKHMKCLGREEMAPDIDVKTIEGKEGIPDLMLSRRFKLARDQFEHLVIELKRPSEKLGREELGQLEVYAMTVAKDERFTSGKYRWTFVIIGNELGEYAVERATSDRLPEGCIYQKGQVSIWVRTWADVFATAKARYEFFREKLELEASGEIGMKYLQSHYPHLMTGRGKRKAADLAITAEKSGETMVPSLD